MKIANNMSDKQIIKWLDKTANSLTLFAHKGGYPNSARGQDLRDRFDELKQEAIFRGVWDNWCKGRSYDTRADGIDFFA
jgi:hypothetical protein